MKSNNISLFFDNKGDEMKTHMVVSVGGGPLASLYGTPGVTPQTPDEFLTDIYNTFIKSSANSIELVCVDPNTDAPYTNNLTKNESGFKNPDYTGLGWNAKTYTYESLEIEKLVEKLTENNQLEKSNPDELEGKAILSIHKYCGSASTNLNNGYWMKDIPTESQDKAVVSFRQKFSNMETILNVYEKEQRTGEVPLDLQKKTKTY